MADLCDSSPVTRLTVKVVPGASSSAIAGWLGDSLRMRLSAAPERGKANAAVEKLGQNPLPGEKVLRRTRYKYGNAARVQPLVLFAIMLLLLGISIWGSSQAEKMGRFVPPCSDNPLGQLVKQANNLGA